MHVATAITPTLYYYADKVEASIPITLVSARYCQLIINIVDVK